MITAISGKSGLSKKDSGKVVKALCEVIREAMNKDDEIALPGIGTFRTAAREERSARNPRTGEMIKVPGGRVVKFKVSSTLKNAVKN